MEEFDFDHYELTPAISRSSLEAFVDILRAEGGEMLGVECRPAFYQYNFPGGRKTNVATCSCSNYTMAAVPYEDEHGGKGAFPACAVCDAATQWPRFH